MVDGRRVLTAALGLFVIASLVTVVVQEVSRADDFAEPDQAATVPETGTVLTAYYFHGNKRCSTCNTIEAYGREAIETRFGDELKSGRIVWRVLNFDDPKNAALRERYALFSSTLLLSDVRDGKERDWYPLDETWKLFRDKQAFLAYVEKETRAILERP